METMYSSSELVNSLSPTQSMPSPSVSATPSLDGLNQVTAFVVLALTPAYAATFFGLFAGFICLVTSCVICILRKRKNARLERRERRSNESSHLLKA